MKCLKLNLTPKYAQTKINVTPQSKIRDQKAINIFHNPRVKNEIKFWYTENNI
jgi:hypothetical protein